MLSWLLNFELNHNGIANSERLHDLQKQFHKFIERNILIVEGEKILLAVSGGMDSMVMLELFHNSSYPFGVAHCNFGLRGAESDGDEDFVSSWAKGRDMDCFVKRIEIEGNAVQLEAREKRYQWFDVLSREKGFDKIATAHHLNDSMETTLINLTRGTGIKGLAGIPLKNDRIIRPLLFASQKQILTFARDQKLRWRVDSSNAKTMYDRNKIRLEVIPKLQEINGSLEETFRYTKERLDLMVDLLKHRVDTILSEYFSEKESELSLEWVRDRKDVLILNEILSGYGFNYATVKEIYEALGKSGKTFKSAKWGVVMDRESLFIKTLEEEQFDDVWIEGDGEYEIGNFKLEVKSWELAVLGQFRDENSAIFDKSKLKFPLRVRKWHEGDTIQPLGMDGTKKISDLLIDLKVPLAKKNQVLVLESSGTIAWVIGYRISEKCKVGDKSKEGTIISFSSV